MSIDQLENVDLATLPCVPLADWKQLPDDSGIYFVMDVVAVTVLYIGQARSIRKRWQTRDLSAWLLSRDRLSIAWWLCDRASLRRVEKQAIAFFQPSLNRSRPSTIPLSSFESLTVRFPQGMLDAMRQAAERHDRSLNAEIVRAVRMWLQRVETGDDDPAEAGALIPALAPG